MSRTTSTHAARSRGHRFGRAGYRCPLGAANWFFNLPGANRAWLSSSILRVSLRSGRRIDHHLSCCGHAVATSQPHGSMYPQPGSATLYCMPQVGSAGVRLACVGRAAAGFAVDRLGRHRHCGAAYWGTVYCCGAAANTGAGARRKPATAHRSTLAQRVGRHGGVGRYRGRRTRNRQRADVAQAGAAIAARRRGRQHRHGQQTQCSFHLLCLLS